MNTKILPLAISAIISISAYAELTLTPTTYEQGGFSTDTIKVSGTGTIADFGENISPSTLWMFGADVTINDPSKTLTLTATGGNKTAWTGLSVYGGSAFYSVVVQNGANKITVNNGGNLRMTANISEFSVYQTGATFELTVAADAGNVDVRKLFVNVGKMTLNLFKQNAFACSTTITPTIGSSQSGADVLTINMTADQKISLDIRNNTQNTFSITNNALLTV